MTNHLSEDELILHYYGETARADEARLESHLASCPECQFANQQLRSRAIRDSQYSIDYLTDELKRTEAVETRTVMYKLMESHLRTMVVARTRADFALRTLDPAEPPDARAYVAPRRVLLILIGAVAGTLLGLLLHGLLLLRRSTVASRSPES